MSDAHPHRLKGRTAIVTGAGSGIGEAIATRLDAEGALVACLDIDEKAAKGVAQQLSSAKAWGCDITNESEVIAAVREAESHFGRPPEILAANAGIEGPVALLTEVSLAEWERVVAVNLTGQFLCAKHVIPRMKVHGRGAIVFTASNSSFTVNPKWGAYTATKGGVLMLARALAVDHAPDNIRVNCVCPGAVDTPLLRRGYSLAYPEEGNENLERTRGRLGQPSEIAGIVAFLVSDEADLMTGAAVVADGGSMLRQGPTWPSPNYWE